MVDLRGPPTSVRWPGRVREVEGGGSSREMEEVERQVSVRGTGTASRTSRGTAAVHRILVMRWWQAAIRRRRRRPDARRGLGQ